MTIDAKVTAATESMTVSTGLPQKLLIRAETDDGATVAFFVPIHQANSYPVGRRVKVTVEPRGR